MSAAARDGYTAVYWKMARLFKWPLNLYATEDGKKYHNH